MSAKAQVAAVVPTLGRSPLLEQCIRALDAQEPRPTIVLVAQGGCDLPGAVLELTDRLLVEEANLGFAAATNLGIRSCDAPWVAAINDDVVVETGWTKELLDTLREQPRAAAAQGVNIDSESGRIDGCGIGWNRCWQATQLLRGEAADAPGAQVFRTAGASATATIYRRSALEEVRLENGDLFDSRFESYYEDVDLALRLGALGFTALCAPAARARHLGSATGMTLGSRRISLIYCNRLLTLARAGGIGSCALLPRLMLRDLADAIRHPSSALGIARGWLRATARLSTFIRGPGTLSGLRAATGSAPEEARSEDSNPPRANSRAATRATRVEPAMAEPEMTGAQMTGTQLAALVVHWHAEDDLAELLECWPQDPRFEMTVVDNGSSSVERLRELCSGRARLVEPGCNLGFSGGVNRAASESTAPLLLILNPDAHPQAGALEALLAAAAQDPGAAGFAPRLIHPDGRAQHRWQLRPLPTLAQLLRQALFLPGPSGPEEPPAPGAPVGQPAAAALLVRRADFEALGGFDENFYPAWHEDVDFAVRLAAAGRGFTYVPDAVFVHGVGGSVGPLGYGRFLQAYYRNLARFVTKHHGRGWATLLRLLLAEAALLRAVALPLRKPSRARSRPEAAGALLALAGAALRNFDGDVIQDGGHGNATRRSTRIDARDAREATLDEHRERNS